MKNYFLWTLCYALFTILSGQSSFGQTTTIYVNANNTGANDGTTFATGFPLLETALSVANAGTGNYEIKVAAGSYKPTTSTNMYAKYYSFTITRGGIKVIGGYNATSGNRNISANPTILTGLLSGSGSFTTNSFHVMVIAGIHAPADSVVLDGFTISGGNASQNSNSTINGQSVSHSAGGGIVTQANNGNPNIAIRNCTFSENKAYQKGAGIYNLSSNPTITNCNFYANIIDNGDGSGGGGGISNESSSPALINCIFKDNIAEYDGGGIYNISSNPVITSCTFNNNNAKRNGGGISNNNSSPNITLSTFSGNKASGGGGIMNEQNSSPTITNSVFMGNIASAYGGGGMSNSYSSPSLINCILIKNSAEGFDQLGGGMLNNTSSTVPIIRNSIIWGNLGGGSPNIYNFGQAPVISNSCVEGGATGSNGNINSEPLFVNLDLPEGADNILGTNDDGLQVLPCSPTVNAGDNTFLTAWLAKDIAGNDRVYNNGIVDMGPYEYQGEIVKGGAALAVNEDENVLLGMEAGQSYTVGTSYNPCISMIKVSSQGETPATGVVRVYVAVDNAVQFHNGSPYVQRHYDVSLLDDNFADATARLTLYFTQEEFTEYNKNLSIGLLPTSSTDNAGKSNLRIYQYHGFPDDNTILPTSYPGPMETLNPDDNDIVWNLVLERWEVSFDVTGFSGFFVGSVSAPLPVKLVRFTATESEGTAQLKWQTTSEVNASHFEIERSFDARSYHRIGEVSAYNGGANLQNYNYPDKDFTKLNTTAYYRLRMVDTDGSFSYSRIVSLSKSGEQSRLFPNPVTSQDHMVLESTSSVEQIRIINQAGQRLQLPIRKIGEGQYEIQVGKTAPGLYILHTGERSHQFLVE